MQLFWLKKVTQPLRPKKNHTTSWDKKITQPLDKKHHATFWDKKNHATSQDNKKMQPLVTKKSRNLSGLKIKQPLGTKKKSNKLSRQNPKLFQKGLNGSK